MADYSSLTGAVASAASGLYAALQAALLSEADRPIRVQIGNDSAIGSPLDTLAVHSFQAVEGTCADSPLRVRMVCMAPRNNLPPKQFLGQPVRLQLVTDSGDLRTFNAIITHAQSAPDDGSGAQPWFIEAVDAMTLMRQGRKSRIFLRASVADIANVILREWSRTLGDTFDFDVKGLQLDRYPAREMTIQWNESDSAFLQRLMRKHGIAWAVKSGDSDGPIAHTLVLFDTPSQLPRNAAGTLRYHVDSAVMEQDAITIWSPMGRITPGTIEGQSWDYKVQRMGEHQSQSLIDFGDRGNGIASSLLDARVDSPHWADSGSDYARLGDLRIQYHEMQAALVQGAGSSRDATVMTRFTVHDRPGVSMGLTSSGDSEGSDDYVYLQVEHWGQNNIPKEHDDWMQVLLAANGWQMQPPNIGHYHEHRRYANTFLAIESGMPIVPRFDAVTDWPTLAPMSGVVVCPGDEQVYCDEYGRVYVQFQGLRVEDHDHASGAGVSGTPADSAPIRVAMPAANPGNGMFQLPRRGDEVLISFIGGDPDKAIITHSIHSPVNVPTSFHGINTLPGNRYLSGNRTQEVFGNQATHILHDNTPQQTSLQAHADKAYSQLTLGTLTTPRADGNANPRGEGAELRTDGHAAMRAGQGLLLSTHARARASGDAMSVDEVNQQLVEAQHIATSLAKSATLAGAQQGEQQAIADALKKQAKSVAGSKPQKQFERPQLVAASAAGIVGSAREQIHLSSGSTTAITTGEHLSVSTGNSFFASVRKTLRFFVYEAGMRLIAKAGDIDIKALKDNINLLAKLKITQVANTIEINGVEAVKLNGGGSYGIFSKDGIKFGTNGKYEVHAASFNYESPDNLSPPTLPKQPPEKDELHIAVGALTGEAHQFANEPYELYKGGAKIDTGVTDEYGRVIVKDHEPGTPAYSVKLSNGNQFTTPVKDELNGDPDHTDQRTNRGVRQA